MASMAPLPPRVGITVLAVAPLSAARRKARATVGPLLKHVEADVQATLNVEAHASRGRSGAAEVEASLRRVAQLDRFWSCPDCGTRIWHKGTPDASRCRCGKRVFPPTPAS